MTIQSVAVSCMALPLNGRLLNGMFPVRDGPARQSHGDRRNAPDERMPGEIDLCPFQDRDHREKAGSEADKGILLARLLKKQAQEERSQQSPVSKRSDFQADLDDRVMRVGEEHGAADQDDPPEER